MTIAVSIVWFRLDLRLDDNPALSAAVKLGGKIVPVFIWSPDEEKPWAPGAASRWWLHHSLESLANSLSDLHCPLLVRQGSSLEELRKLVRETTATQVFWNRRYEPRFRDRDGRIKKALRADGLHVESFNASLLYEPAVVTTKEGKPFQVFTAFWNACQHIKVEKPTNPPATLLPHPVANLNSLAVDELGLVPSLSWPEGLAEDWQPGEPAARAAWQRFRRSRVENYRQTRDFPAVAGTSRLSPHLHFGELSLRRLWHDLNERFDKSGAFYFRELGWREFAHHLLYHFPNTSEHALRPRFEAFPWRRSPKDLRAWQRGQTGYPLVDAGMRELWKTGWMHNRVRMVVGSFLVKHLLIAWQRGAEWFWDTLVDADLANNTLGWQWCAGCGADAAPYFRVFNPVLQGEKFDPEGAYVKHWVPELAQLPARWIHKPWKAPAEVLAGANVKLGSTYPGPIVDHAEARTRALMAFATIKS
jgi:deoxyribodipyrimidine photo-lyase